MTHRNDYERNLVVNFVNQGGRFTRYVRPLYLLSSRMIRPAAHHVESMTQHTSVNIRHLPVPGTRGFLHGWSDSSNPIYIENRSEVTTIAYRNSSEFFEFAAVTWHPDSYTYIPFNHQENNVHAVQRFDNAKIVVPMSDLQQMVDDRLIYISKNGNIVHIEPLAMAYIVQTYGHYSSREDVSQSL